MKRYLILALVLLALLAGPVMAATYDTSGIIRWQYDWTPDPRVFYVTIHNVENSGGWTGLHIERTLVRTTLGQNTSHTDVPIIIRDDTNSVTLGEGTMSVVGKEYALAYSGRYYYYYDVDISVDDWTPPAGKTDNYRVGIYNQSPLGGWWGPAGRSTNSTDLAKNHPVWSTYSSAAQLVVWKSGYSYDGYPSENLLEYSEISDPAPPVAGFTCNFVEPVKQSPFDLVCVDNSTGYPAPSAVNWTLTQPDGSTYRTTNTSLVKTLSMEGGYGLDFVACNAYGCGFANTSHLVNLTTGYIPTTGISFWAHAYDPLKSAKIAGATVGIQNLTSGTWRNLSTSDGSARFTSTDYYLKEKLTAGQTVGLMASASGYITANTTVTIPYDGWEYLINLVATGDVPTGANATLYVNVIDAHTMKGLSGATVTISNTSIPYSSSKLSNTGGIATFPNIASGTYSIVATKTGYTSSTVSWPAGASAVTNAYMSLLPTGATPVVTGTGGNPLFDGDGNPIVGYDLDGNPITAGPTPDTRTAEEKDDEMMDMLRDQGPMLIQFFIVCFVVYMVMGMAGRGGR